MVCSGSGGTSLCCGGCVVVGNGVVGALMLSSCLMAGVCGSVRCIGGVCGTAVAVVGVLDPSGGPRGVKGTPLWIAAVAVEKGLQLVVDLVQVRGPVALPSPHQ